MIEHTLHVRSDLIERTFLAIKLGQNNLVYERLGGVGGRLLPWTTLGLLCLRISHVSTPSGAFEGRLPVIANLPSAAGSSDCSVASRASESAAQAAARVRLAIEEI